MTLPTITATGNLGRDPEMRTTRSGKVCADLSIGCNKNRKNERGEWETVSTTWLRVTLWGAEAERARDIFRKGHEVTVTGQLSVREYEKQDGSKGTAIEVDYPTVSLPKIREDRQAPAAATSEASAWGQPSTGGDSWATRPATDAPPF